MNNAPENRTELMRQIRDEVINLKESPLYLTRIKPVIGEGSHTARIVFVGEAPGKTEAEQGRPFCGRAGKILDTLLASVALNRADVYVTNIIKDRPPNNRDPFPEEIALYAPFLDRQIAIIQPQALVALGRFSMTYLLEKFNADPPAGGEPVSISKVHGTVFPITTEWGSMDIVVLYHPAVAIYNDSMRGTLEKDFQILKTYMRS